jgi:hypothetical protein
MRAMTAEEVEKASDAVLEAYNTRANYAKGGATVPSNHVLHRCALRPM